MLTVWLMNKMVNKIGFEQTVITILAVLLALQRIIIKNFIN